jgi:Secretion system C-terminal sorting domain
MALTTGDGNWSEVFSFTVGFVGVNESEIGRLSIYPNPADQNLQIKYSSPIESVFIKDLSGRIVEQIGTTNQLNQTLNIAPLAPGIYLLEVNGAVARFIKK